MLPSSENKDKSLSTDDNKITDIQNSISFPAG
jgi:hypothetical protein